MCAEAIFLLSLCAPAAWAQTEAPATPPMSRTERNDRLQSAPLTTFYLKNSSQPNDGNEILTGIRLMCDPSVKVYLVPSQNAIMMRGLPDDVALATRILSDMDRPRKTYRITYTLTEMDGGKRVGSEHFAMSVLGGQRATLKRGSKVPVVTASPASATDAGTPVVTYVDVGLSFDSTLSDFPNGLGLRAKVEQSALTGEKGGASAQDPVIRQTVLEGVSNITLGKPALLGSLDMSGGTGHMEVEVLVEPVR